MFSFPDNIDVHCYVNVNNRAKNFKLKQLQVLFNFMFPLQIVKR